MYGERAMRFLYKYKFIMLFAFAAVLLFAISKTKSLSKEIDTFDEGYTTVNSVPGVTFDVERKISDSAQAVMEISNNVSFLNYQTYVYKNGVDTYTLFNIKDMIVVCKKGTSYDLSNGTEALTKKSLNGIRFEPLGSVTKSGKVTEVLVSAEAVITNDVYNDFTGKVATISKDGVEYTLFAGTIQKDMERVNAIIDSFTLSDDLTNNLLVYSVDMESEEKEEVDTSDKVEEAFAQPITEEETNKEDEKEKEEKQAVSEVNKALPVIVESEPVKEAKETFSVASNQVTYDKEEGKAYSSSIYSMLSVSDTGFVSLLNGSMKYENAYVRVTSIKEREEVQSLIDRYIESGESYYKSFEIPKGMHLEACVYDVKYESKDSYLNVLLKGVDGNSLVYNGVTYPQRTYDILSKENAKEWIQGNVAFYLVPNGCEEYVLQFGDGENEEKAFYYIKK